MAGSSIGEALRVTTFGESHGPAIGVIIDGCPAQLKFDDKLLVTDLQRRRPGRTKAVTQRKEEDVPEVLSGIFEGLTTGAPITIVIANQDARSKDYSKLRDVFRPGHADYTYLKKYGLRDHRGSGRASARETAARVAAGAVAKMVLSQLAKVRIRGCLRACGTLQFAKSNWAEANRNPYFCPDPAGPALIEKHIAKLRKAGDSCGALLEVEALNVPAGLGEPVFDRLDADIAKGLMSINAVKAVEIGDGLDVVEQAGSEHGDEMTGLGKFSSNHAGGILGGISTGQTVRARLALKPTSSITTPRNSVNKRGKPVKVATTGRHDPCVGLRATPIAEAMLAIVLADHLLRQRGQAGHI